MRIFARVYLPESLGRMSGFWIMYAIRAMFIVQVLIGDRWSSSSVESGRVGRRLGVTIANQLVDLAKNTVDGQGYV